MKNIVCSEIRVLFQSNTTRKSLYSYNNTGYHERWGIATKDGEKHCTSIINVPLYAKLIFYKTIKYKTTNQFIFVYVSIIFTAFFLHEARTFLSLPTQEGSRFQQPRSCLNFLSYRCSIPGETEFFILIIPSVI